MTRNDALNPVLDVDSAFKVLSGVQDQVRLADTKAAFIFTINTLMCGFIAPAGDSLRKGFSVEHVHWSTIVAMVALVMFAGCVIVALGHLMWAVYPRLGERAPSCRIFFGHIVAAYNHDYEKYADALRAMTADEWMYDVGTQIVETSSIAHQKHEIVGFATKVTMAALASWIVAVFMSLLLPN